MSQLVLEQCSVRGHEQVCFFNYPDVGLKLIVAIHDTTLGPSLGGCRMRLYQNEAQAIDDVLRLSEGMTYKSSLAGLNLGGGKSCIIANPAMTEGREALFKKVGDCLNHLGGRYIVAEDMGTCVEDMMWVKTKSRHVAGTDPKSGGMGDPSPWTALGVFNATRAAVERVFPGKAGLNGLRVSVQGVGHVGMYLVEHLTKAGAKVTVCDTNAQSVKTAVDKFGVEVASTDSIYDVPCDIFAPCAIGQTVNTDTLKRLSCKIVSGAANNQLPDSSVYEILRAKKIVYCPDFAINSGGVICVAAEASEAGATISWVKEKIEAIYNTTCSILDESERSGRDAEVVAIQLAKDRIADAKRRMA
jgi:leucine dehydrogenase